MTGSLIVLPQQGPSSPRPRDRWDQAIKSCLLALRTVGLYFVDTVNALFYPVDARDGVLIVRTDGIGDLVLWLDAADALVKHYRSRGASVTLLVNSQSASWARELGLFDEIVALETRRFSADLLYRWRMIRRVRGLRPRTVLQPTYSRTTAMDLLIRVSGAPERICSAGEPSEAPTWQMGLRNSWYTRIVPAERKPLMELLRNAEFTRAIVGPTFLARIPDLKKLTSLPNYDFPLHELRPDQPYYVVFPGASSYVKRWPLENFRQVAEHIHARTNWTGIVCGSPTERDLARELCSLTKAPLINLVEKTSLMELSGILAQSRLLVSNDTVATHLAAATGTATVCILGGAQFGRFLPYQVEAFDGRPLPIAVFHPMDCFGCNWKCIFPRIVEQPDPCVSRISVSPCIQAIDQCLGDTGRARSS